ncbi:enoyl-CoA hydratase [Caballeronia temeraria]|uniref:Enoyl-CoA hydratase n=1 Tax=Caballeronia temeraria TaxID=1777137 RepID=A0A158APB6_9BURK|nr:enoyl-CoA hydratase/isomerase family protein [Caballeronia temeraria]SAK59652.1 enoyl-CoA hydratase [Caballeronia temeraria]
MHRKTFSLREATLTIDDGVAEFTHQRPQARNALSLNLRADYLEMLDCVEGNRDVRVLIVTGAGGSFCAGGDLKSLKELRAEDGSPDAMRRRIIDGHTWMLRLRNLEMPVIAAVDGPAVGAGFSIALAADFVLASSRAFFCMSFAKVGLVPDLGAAYFLPRMIGLSAAKELAMTARRVDAHEAKQLGIVHAIHSPETLAEDARAFARRFLPAPREATGLTKRMMDQSFETPYAALADMESAAQALASTTAYHTNAVNAFLDGRGAAFDWERSR